MSTTKANERAEFEYIPKDGRVIRNYRGKEVLLATFDETDGHLEFESEKADIDYRVQVQRTITEDTAGLATNLKIISYGIKGRARDEKQAKEPGRPKADPMLGDKTPAVVEWFFKWRPQEAYVRYGVEFDSEGNPVIAHCVRFENRVTGNSGREGQVEEREYKTENKEGIIARRQTNRTFLRSEMVEKVANEVPVEAAD